MVCVLRPCFPFFACSASDYWTNSVISLVLKTVQSRGLPREECPSLALLAGSMACDGAKNSFTAMPQSTVPCRNMKQQHSHASNHIAPCEASSMRHLPIRRRPDLHFAPGPAQHYLLKCASHPGALPQLLITAQRPCRGAHRFCGFLQAPLGACFASVLVLLPLCG